MKKIERQEILSNAEYERIREQMRGEILHIKRDRRVHLGQNLTLLFENHRTVLYHIQEALRIEKNIDEAMIGRELEHYNQLIGQKGEIGCSLLVEIDETTQHGLLISEWQDVPEKIYLKTKKGQQIWAQCDPQRIREKSIHGVHHLLFRLGDEIPVGLGCNHPGVHLEIALLPPQIAALAEDLQKQAP